MTKPLWMQIREAFERKGYFHPSQVAARDDIIGSWLSAALEDPNAGPEFKADVQRWFETGHHEALEAYGREKVREGMKRAVELYPQGIAAILAAMEKEGGE